MNTEMVDVNIIETEGRLRAADPEKVVVLAQSIEAMGLRTPITIRWKKDDAGEETPVLVAGLHRLEAMKLLGREDIPCIAMRGASEIDARLWEIAENLHRADLTIMQRSEQVAEWIRLMEAKAKAEAGGANCAGSLRDGRKAGPQHKPSGINAAVKELGIDRSEAQRAVKIAAIAPEAKAAAAAAGVTTQSALLEVAREPIERQPAKVAEIKKRVEDRKIVQKAGDEIVQRDAADDAAEMLIDFIPESKMDQLLGYLDASGAGRITKAIRRTIKTKDVAA